MKYNGYKKIPLCQKYIVHFFWDADSWENIVKIFYKHPKWEMIEYTDDKKWFGCDAPDKCITLYADCCPKEFYSVLQSCLIDEYKDEKD